MAVSIRSISDVSHPSSVNQYIMMKSLQSPTYIGALAKPFQNAVRDLVKDKIAERAPGYIESVFVLTEKGRDLLKFLRDSPEVSVDLERLAKRAIELLQPKVDALHEKLFPNFNSYRR